jgi:hypothetical protein
MVLTLLFNQLLSLNKGVFSIEHNHRGENFLNYVNLFKADISESCVTESQPEGAAGNDVISYFSITGTGWLFWAALARALQT